MAMNAMTILKRCRGAEKEIERLEEKIRQRRYAAGARSSLGGMPGGGGVSDPTGRAGTELAELDRRKEERRLAWQAEIDSATILMDYVPIRESKVLSAYWIEGKSTGDIAREKHYTAAYVRRTKRNGEMMLEMLDIERVRATLPRWYLEDWWEE